MNRRFALLFVPMLLACTRDDTGDTPETGAPAPAPPAETVPANVPADAPRVEILEPANGAEVTGPSVIVMLSARNVTIAPAGDSTPGTGHHHLFVNVAPVTPGTAIPAGVPRIVHLGKAQTSHTLTGLTPGEYTVIAVLGDLVHRRIDPQVTDTVRFTVR